MAAEFKNLRIKAIERSTEDSVVLEFDVPEELRQDYEYVQGQYLTLKAEINGEEVRRSYSLCSSPVDHIWRVAVKQVDNGRFSTYANTVLKAGDSLDVMTPMGNFYVESHSAQAKNYVAFAAGSGITPICSIIKTHLEKEPDSTFKLFYVNKNVRSIMLKEEIEALKNVYLERFELYHFLTRESRNSELLNGRLNEEKLETIFQKIVRKEVTDHYFICGPTEMIFMIKDWLAEKGVEKEKIHFELFTTEGIPEKKTEAAAVSAPAPESSAVTITEGGKTFTFQFGIQADNILDEAMRNGADLPYACKGGVCCTCKALLVEGKVDMEVNYALEEEEVEEGYILTCQSVPKTEIVKINFDY